MTEAQSLHRQIKPKRQAFPLIKAEIRNEPLRLSLLEMKSNLESQIDVDFFDPVLSQKIDVMTVLLEE